MKKLAESLDLDAIGVVHAVEYAIGGIKAVWIVDGQHRVYTLRKLELDDWVVDVSVHIDVVDDARASKLFLELNDRAPVRTLDKFKNELQCGDPVATAVRDIASKHGISILSSGGRGSTRSVASLKASYLLDKGSSLDAALGIIREAWRADPSAYEGKIIEGISLIVKTYNGKLDARALATSLMKHSNGAGHIIGRARTIREAAAMPQARAIAQAVLEIYNRGRRTGKLDPL